MPLLLTAATALELATAVPHLSPENLAEHSLKDFFAADRHWIACVTGVGPVNAGIALGAALMRPDIRGVLNIGFAGSFDLTRAPLGSTVVVNEEIWPEYGLADEHGVDAAALGFPLWQPDDDAPPLYDRIALCAQAEDLGLNSVQHLTQGSSLTVAGVSSSVQRAGFLQQKYAPLLENMEGFAVALACARHGIPLLELRTVSNLVGSRKPEHRDFPLARASMRKFFLSYLSYVQKKQ